MLTRYTKRFVMILSPIPKELSWTVRVAWALAGVRGQSGLRTTSLNPRPLLLLPPGLPPSLPPSCLPCPLKALASCSWTQSLAESFGRLCCELRRGPGNTCAVQGGLFWINASTRCLVTPFSVP